MPHTHTHCAHSQDLEDSEGEPSSLPDDNLTGSVAAILCFFPVGIFALRESLKVTLLLSQCFPFPKLEKRYPSQLNIYVLPLGSTALDDGSFSSSGEEVLPRGRHRCCPGFLSTCTGLLSDCHDSWNIFERVSRLCRTLRNTTSTHLCRGPWIAQTVCG